MQPSLTIGLLFLGLPVCAGWMLPGSIEIGVLSCTGGQTIHAQVSTMTSGAGDAREMICSFKPHRNGAEETYSAVMTNISSAGPLSEKLTMLWVVRAPVGTQSMPCLLRQSFAADVATPAGQAAPLVGARNDAISLQPMNDKQEGSAAKEKRAPSEFVVTGIELVLKIAVG